MTSHCWSRKSRKPGEAGQAILFVMLAMGLVLLGAVAFSVDMGNLWFHRQSAQSVADSACTAAAMDMLFTANGGGAVGGFTPGTNFSCSGSPYGCTLSFMRPRIWGLPRHSDRGDAGLRRSLHVSYFVSRSCPRAHPGQGRRRSAMVRLRLQSITSRSTWMIASDSLSQGCSRAQQRLMSAHKSKCGVVFSSSPIPILVLDPSD